MNYADAKIRRDALEAESSRLTAIVNSYPRSSNGLTPDEVKFSPAYRADLAACNRAVAELKAFNVMFTRVFRREYAAERRLRRA